MLFWNACVFPGIVYHRDKRHTFFQGTVYSRLINVRRPQALRYFGTPLSRQFNIFNQSLQSRRLGIFSGGRARSAERPAICTCPPDRLIATPDTAVMANRRSRLTDYLFNLSDLKWASGTTRLLSGGRTCFVCWLTSWYTQIQLTELFVCKDIDVARQHSLFLQGVLLLNTILITTGGYKYHSQSEETEIYLTRCKTELYPFSYFAYQSLFGNTSSLRKWYGKRTPQLFCAAVSKVQIALLIATRRRRRRISIDALYT